MIKSIYRLSLLFVLLISCARQNSKTSSIKEEASIINENILEVFSDVDSILKKDNGKFWRHQIYGPILMVDPKTRVFIANENNLFNTFKKTDSVYVDTLPNTINIANTSINWENKRWSMVMLPLPENKIDRNNLIIHELFHRIQPKIGFKNLKETDNKHLDIYNGRLLLRLELEALKSAINSNDLDRKNHIENALLFRNKRHFNDDIKQAENSLELNEGIAEYTAIMLSGVINYNVNNHFENQINQFYKNKTFVRSFAYQTIPMYGYLLSKVDKNWHLEVTETTNLTDLFVEKFMIETKNDKSAEEIANGNDYNYEIIVEEEKVREEERLKKIEALKIKFLTQPSLKLNFEKMNINFNPTNIIPLENFGTVYPTLRITDDWGVLTVENGALLSSNWDYVIVSKPLKLNDNKVEGDGWILELNENWSVVEKKQKYQLVKNK